MTNILHGTWIPDNTEDFVQQGEFYLWIETDEISETPSGNIHPFHLRRGALATFLKEKLGIAIALDELTEKIRPQYFLLPTHDNIPLPSWELARYLETELPEDFNLQFWPISCYCVGTKVKLGSYNQATVNNIIKLLNDLHFLATYSADNLQFGSDLLFWYGYTRTLREIIFKDEYIPALKYQQIASTQAKKRKKTNYFAIYPSWEIVSDRYETILQDYAEAMPLACAAGFNTPTEVSQFYEPQTLLRHFSENILSEILTHTPKTAQFDRKIAGTILEECCDRTDAPSSTERALEQYQQWQIWRQKIDRSQSAIPFILYFQLISPDVPDQAWFLEFLVSPKNDPSAKLTLLDYWRMNKSQQNQIKKQMGEDFEANLLLNLGYAARIYPKLWEGMNSDRPTGCLLHLEDAYDFLKETAWVLEDAGYKVIIPSWWTPMGRRRAKVRLKAAKKGKSVGSAGKGYFNLDTLITYQYELAIGNEQIAPQEWEDLVNAKQSLVQFRGEWVELDVAKMKQMLEFWQKQGEENAEMSLMELMQREAEEDEDLEIERDDSLGEMWAKLHDPSNLSPVEELPQFEGTLREYQKRGVAWLDYLEQLGLNGCLADDMGLGKTIQVIARLVQERNADEKVFPTLLIAPTSVLGNWQKEISKFAPHLSSIVHHGSDRANETKTFKKECKDKDVVITSYTLVRKDTKLFDALDWHRIVLDEAQNIKNPKTAQTKAILKLKSRHRLALTGTPVENRLLDLWSIFNFLNPGYLGKQAQFRKAFELPVQKDNDLVKTVTLKRLVEPFILRRVKTDKSIIKDLPDKIEQKVYCNLTKEQASLYEAVVKNVTEQLEEAEGMQRKGLMLATLMKLKQICNHPRQFLQDESEFTPERSHKLSRLQEMIEEIIAEQESTLIFTQFREIGDALEYRLRHDCHYNTYYIHGGTSRQKRENAIADFQDPDTPPSIFVLSLKAAGVGITLTKANHVFHFDRWWNPAVEDQATDRAFRIGQEKNVFVHKYVTLGTLEERIDQMIEDKKKLSASIVGSDESWLTELDNNSFKELIALNRTAIL
ncbi:MULTISPECIES: DEAD/DEAH box helicase [Spirulina sp. CCY15215]|uniref:DEAD/DEAH box helicase n=1 Tax=Spirulina sp. CCY15215 TaxID=2767591 RepID=UPI00194E295A|nr:DEAD/DEAH box helicase [Spirulina major]